jgi:hypothetical protein
VLRFDLRHGPDEGEGDAELRGVRDHVAAAAERADDQAHRILASGRSLRRRSRASLDPRLQHLVEDDPAGLDLDGRLAQAEVEEVGAPAAFDAPADDVALMIAQRLAVEPVRRDLVERAGQAERRRRLDLRLEEGAIGDRADGVHVGVDRSGDQRPHRPGQPRRIDRSTAELLAFAIIGGHGRVERPAKDGRGFARIGRVGEAAAVGHGPPSDACGARAGRP